MDVSLAPSRCSARFRGPLPKERLSEVDRESEPKSGWDFRLSGSQVDCVRYWPTSTLLRCYRWEGIPYKCEKKIVKSNKNLLWFKSLELSTFAPKVS